MSEDIDLSLIFLFLINGGYTSNALIGAVGYVPHIVELIKLYRHGKADQGSSIMTFLIWSVGAIFTTLFGAFIAMKWQMIIVGGATLFLNLVIITLIIAVRQKHRKSLRDLDASYQKYD